MVRDRDAPRSPGDGGGEVRAAGPAPEVEVGSPVELAGELVVGPHGIEEGGAIQLVATPFWGWSPPQAEAEGAPGHTLLEPPPGVDLETRSAGGLLIATVRGRRLEPGERVRFVYGAGGTARADRFAERAPALWVGVDADGDGVRGLVRSAPLEVRTVAGPPARLVATLPSVARPGQEVALRLAVLDAVGNAGRPAELAVRLSLPAEVGGPSEVRLQAGDRGVLRVPLVSAAGVVRIRAEAEGLPPALSNPMVVRDGAEPVLWADLHVHTALSDGTGQPEEVLAYARDVAGLDVVALTDHDHWGMVFLDQDAAGRARIAEAVRAAARPGFVPLVGFEWTSWLYGHRHVLFLDGPPDRWPSSLEEATDTPAELHAALLGAGGISVPHHPAGGPVPLDWPTALHEEVETLVELTSVHGQSASAELPGAIRPADPSAFVEDHLRGERGFALLGSTDAHDGHPGLAHLAGGGGGLTALEGAEPTLEGVKAALAAGRTWATNGPRILLRVRAGSAGPGGRVEIRDRAPDLEIRVIGTAALASVEVRHRGGTLATLPGGGAVLHEVLPLDLEAGDRVWVRVTQVDGGMAWSSPIALDLPGPTGDAPPWGNPPP